MKLFGLLNPMNLLGHFSPMLFEDDPGAPPSNPPADPPAEPPATSWLDVLPEDARKDPAVTKYKTADEFYKGYRNTLELVGRKGVLVPKPDSPKEEVEKFYNSLGRPEKPDGYKFKPLENVHPNVKVTPEMEAGIKNLFHERGIPQPQAEALFNDFIGGMSQSHFNRDQQITEQTQKAETELRNEWGEKYDNNVKMATQFVKRFGGDKALEAFKELGAGRNPDLLRVFANAGKMVSEDTTGKIGFTSLGTSKQEALKRIADINNDTKGPLYHENHPQHRAVVEERDKLYQIAYGEEE